MSNVIPFHYQGQPVNATDVAKRFGKRPVDWLKQAETKEYLSTLAEALTCDAGSLVETSKARADRGGAPGFIQSWRWHLRAGPISSLLSGAIYISMPCCAANSPRNNNSTARAERSKMVPRRPVQVAAPCRSGGAASLHWSIRWITGGTSSSSRLVLSFTQCV